MSAEKDTGGQPPGDGSSQDKVVPKARPQSRIFCGWKCFAVLPILIIVTLYYTPYIIAEYEGIVGYGHAPVYADIAPEVMDSFRYYDVDVDGKINPYEFVMITQDVSLNTFKSSAALSGPDRDIFEFIDSTINEDTEVVTIVAEMEPLDIQTMTKFSGEQASYIGNPETLVPGLCGWKKPYHPAHTFPMKHFELFLPPAHHHPRSGKPYYIIEADFEGIPTHMNSYHPPKPLKNEVLLQTLLSMLHPNAFVRCRFGPRGTVGLVRAENEDYYDILIRAHAEFQLNTQPHYPFWFTPGQFAGRLLIRKDSRHLEYFELGISTAKSLNIDMEWMTGKSENEVDIGFMPQLRLYAPVPSTLFNPNNSVPHQQQPYDFNKFTWNYQIPVEQGISAIEKKMYPFKEVPYLNYLDAFKVAEQENKLVHFIMLWGALDDQSC